MAILLSAVSTLPASANLMGNNTVIGSAADAAGGVSEMISEYTFDALGEWKGRGSASAALSDKYAMAGTKSLYVTGRAASWNGAEVALDSSFKAGNSYSFSACVRYDAGAAQTKFHLSLQYTGTDDKAAYDKIASVDVPKDGWVQLANAEYTLPAGATNFILYVETETGSSNFYVDKVQIAAAGTQIDGPKPKFIQLGDPSGDGAITAEDLSIAKKGILTGAFDSDTEKKACDVNYDREVNAADIVWFHKFIMGEETQFPEKVYTEPEQLPMRTISEYTPVCEPNLVMKEPDNSHSEVPGTQYGTITKKQYFSKKANKNKPYNILLPANYDESKQYPVLYLLHGFFENEDRMITKGNGVMYTRQIIGNAIAAGEAEDMIVVVPWIFTHPTKENATSFQDYESSVGYDNFVDDIVDSLMPHIEETYSVKTGRENTAVTGFSMGGRESLRIGMKYPDKFGYVGAICPAPGVEGPWSWSEETAPSLILLTGGTNDDVVGLSTPEGYHNNFNKASTPHIWHVVQGGYHGDNCIHAHIYNFCRFIFKA